MCDMVSERELDSMLDAAAANVLYVLPDDGDMSECLLRCPKYMFADGSMFSWPGRCLVPDFARRRPAAWTRYFLLGSQALACQLENVRTILKARGSRGVPQYVLITGETGTGKSFVARSLAKICDERYDDREACFTEGSEGGKGRGFLHGNCASLSPALADALLFGAVKGPVYHLLDVEKPDQRVIETMGLPLTVIQNVVVQRPDALDEELSAFADAVAPREVWEEYYELGDFNRFKWKGADKDAIDAVGRGGLLRLMLHCFRLAPAESWQALFALTDMVYSVEGSPEDDNISPLLAGGDPLPGLGGRFDIRPQLLEYQRFFQGTALSYTRHIGLTLLALLTAALAECDLGRWQDWKKLLIVLSLFCYDFGTMLLLTGADYRFFYVSFPLCPVFLLLLLYDPEKAGPPTDA